MRWSIAPTKEFVGIWIPELARTGRSASLRVLAGNSSLSDRSALCVAVIPCRLAGRERKLRQAMFGLAAAALRLNIEVPLLSDEEPEPESRSRVFSLWSFRISSPFAGQLPAVSKSPSSAVAAARVSRQDGLVHSVNSQAPIASATACLPSRNPASKHVALIPAPKSWPEGFWGSSQRPWHNRRGDRRIRLHC